jgi:hypothetical protein
MTSASRASKLVVFFILFTVARPSPAPSVQFYPGNLSSFQG